MAIWPSDDMARPTASLSRMCTENGGRRPAGRRVTIPACGTFASRGVSDAAIGCNKIRLQDYVHARFRRPVYDHQSEFRPTGGRHTFVLSEWIFSCTEPSCVRHPHSTARLGPPPPPISPNRRRCRCPAARSGGFCPCRQCGAASSSSSPARAAPSPRRR